MTPDRIEVDGIPYVRAYPVAGRRCPHCGGRHPYWTPGRIIAALRAHADKHDGAGPKSSAWSHYAPGHPAAEAVRRVFGTWRKGLKAAGVRPGGGRHMWTRELIIDRILDWHMEHGCPPRVHDWKKASGRWPSEATVRKHFGTFNAGVAAAGITPRQKGSRYRIAPFDRANRRLVPAEPFADMVRRYLADGTTTDTLAELSGVDEAVIRRLVKERKTFVLEETAEALCLAIGREDLMAAAA